MNELNLLAYADGHLDADPHHKAAVEAALRADPVVRARAQALRAQTEALRAAYAWRLSEPVPERLAATLEIPARPWRGMRGAAGLLLALTAGTAGWMLGQGTDPVGGERPAGMRLSERSYAQFVADRPSDTAPPPAAAVAAAQPMDWLADELSMRLKTPDLSAAGYALVEKKVVTVDGERTVQLDYSREDGRFFSLFLAPRWETDRQEINAAEREGVTVATWLDGPLASAVVMRMPPNETRRLAEAVRQAMHASGAAPAVLEPTPTVPDIAHTDAIADTLAGPTTAVPQTIGPLPDGGTLPN